MPTLSNIEEIQLFDQNECFLLRGYVVDFTNWFQRMLISPITVAMATHVPAELIHLLGLMATQTNTLVQGSFPKKITDLDAPVLKRAILQEKKTKSEENEILRQKTYHPELLKMVDSEMEFLDSLFEMEWFQTTAPTNIPKLTDFLTLKVAYEVLNIVPGKFESIFDEKFGYLHSPQEFLPRLKQCRVDAWLRDTTTSVAFVDIDKFKDFNLRHTETQVDREMLPRVMLEVESHIFSHGWAYRFGGDEYVLLMPNTITSQAVDSLFNLKDRLSDLRFFGDDKISVSIGICSAGPDSFLTDQEILQQANVAESFAKKERNCIATNEDGPKGGRILTKVERYKSETK